MKSSTTMLTRKRRGPKPTGKGTLVGVRIQPPMLAALDAFIAEEREPVSRPEAVRVLLKDSLEGLGLLKQEH